MTWAGQARLVVIMVATVVGFPVVGVEPAHGAPAARDDDMELRVTPSSSLFDTPLKISVRGLKPSESATLRVTSTDVNGIPFASEATFRANDGGLINPARVAPVSGSYTGVQPMGLIDFMSPSTPGNAGLYFWGNAPLPFNFTVTSDDRPPASVSVQRSLTKAAITQRRVTLDQAAFVGQMWQPALGSAKKPALLVIGGSEGGLRGQLISALLAAHGHPTLNIAYFNEAGLPPRLSSIPLEYFAHALTWLGQQPNVDPDRSTCWAGPEEAKQHSFSGFTFETSSPV